MRDSIRCVRLIALATVMLAAGSAALFADAEADNRRAEEAAARAAELQARDAVSKEQAAKEAAIAQQKAKDGLKVLKRSLIEAKDKPGEFKVLRMEEKWNPRETVLIICDVWDSHHCYRAVLRVEEMVKRMNDLTEKARSMGVLIIHAPSDCMAAYKDHPGRKLAQAAPMADNLPKDIATWCYKIPSEDQGKYPIDQSDGGEDDEPKEHAQWQAKLAAAGRNPRAPWKQQHTEIKIAEGDAISDKGVEVWNLLESRGIKNVMIMGVHTNMCVLGRPFGLRRMASNGKNTVLIRDMTDTMYNPAMPPKVSHFQGTALIIEHIEKYVCPTITSDQFLGGEVFKFKGDDGK